jgi:hypothetical protein
MYSICIITPLIDVLFILIPINWIITGSRFRWAISKKGKKTFIVYTITEVVYYSMDKYLTKLLKL